MAGSKILIIDADLASRSYVSAALQRGGYEVLSTGSGKEGLISAWRDRPDLIIIDPVVPDIGAEELATRLRSDARSAKVPLLALSSDSKPARRTACLRAGFDDYLLKSPKVLDTLLVRLTTLLARGHAPAASAKEDGYLVAFLSAKGGTGTSSLCANLAMHMTEDRPQASVAVADLVLPIGSIAGIVGYEGAENLVTVARLPEAENIAEYLRNCLTPLDLWHFHLLAGSPDPGAANDLDVQRIGEVVTALAETYDFVLLDLGRSLSRISLPLIEQADVIVMITGSDLSTVTLTRTVWQYLRSKGVRPSSVYLILNRAVGLEGVSKQEAEKIIGLPIQTAMPYLGSNVSVANNQHHPYVMNFPADTASIILKETARQMGQLARNLRAPTPAQR